MGVMRVCMVAPSVKIPEPLAQSIHQSEFAKNLVRRGIEVHLVCRRDRSQPSQESGIFFHGVFSGELPFKRLIFTHSARRRVKALIREQDIDLIHDRGYLFGGSGISVAHRMGIPTILQIDDDWIKTEALVSRIAASKMHQEMALRWCRRTLQKAALAFAVSESLRNVAIKSWGADPRRIHVIPNGVDLDLFSPKATSFGLRERLGAQDERIICFVGALGPWHGIDLLLTAFAQALKKRGNLRLVVVGSAKEYSIGHLRNQTLQLGIAGRVHFLGRLEHHQIPGVLVDSDVAVAPYPEADFGFSPLKIFEYMACGVPAIVSDTPSTREIVSDGENGLLVRPGDAHGLAEALVRVLDDPDLTEILRKGALEAAKSFSWENSTEKLIGLYKHVAG